MPTYALLGATGATGSAILNVLLDASPADLQLRVLVRSEPKLHALVPRLQAFQDADPTSANTKITIHQGDATDTNALKSCIAHAQVIFMCVGSNHSARGDSLTSDTVQAIIDTLDAMRKSASSAPYRAPTVLQLRSASLNPRLSCHVPWLVWRTVCFCLHYSHLDLKHACRLYEAAALDGLLNYVYVDPPTIHGAFATKQTGFRLITHEKQDPALSYADLGASFVQIAANNNQFRNQAIGVVATGSVATEFGLLAGYLISGAREHIKGIARDEPQMLINITLVMICGGCLLLALLWMFR